MIQSYRGITTQTNKQNKCRPIFPVADAGAGWNNRFARSWIFDTYDARAGGSCRCRQQPVIVDSVNQINRVVFNKLDVYGCHDSSGNMGAGALR